MLTSRITLAALAGAAIAAGGAAAGGTADAVVVKLRPVGGSGVSGTATLTPLAEGFRVTIKLAKPVRGTLPAHLHIGPCRIQPNMNVKSGLESVVRGRSVTTITTSTLGEVRTGKLSIQVHAPTFEVIACGDIPKR